MQESILVFGIIIILVLGLLPFLENKPSWGIFAFLGGIIGIFFTATLGADGSIVVANAYNVSTGTWATQTISSYPYIYIPLIFTIVDFLIVLYRVPK